MCSAPAARIGLLVQAVRDAEFIEQVRVVRAGVAHGVTQERYTEYNSREGEVLRYIEYILTKYIRYNLLILKVFNISGIFPKQKRKYIRYIFIILKVLTTIQYIFQNKNTNIFDIFS